jgi:hypothetical protein
MIRIDVSSNIAAARERTSQLTKAIEDRATVAALNRTATTVRAAGVREIRKEYPGLRAGAIRDELKILRANRGRLMATVSLRGSRIALIEFSPRQTKKGVSVRIKGQRKLIPHAFIATMDSGLKSVFVRAYSSKRFNAEFRYGKGSRVRSSGPDTPIAELMSISLPRAFVNKKVQAALKLLARETFIKNFRAELAFRSARGR